MSRSFPDLADLGVLAGLAPELAATFASIASDIALVIGDDGVIRNAALGEASINGPARQWVGRAFVDTVTQETRIKIQQLLQEVGSTGISRRREVNLPGAEGLDIPVVFAAIRLGRDGPVLAVGRDLRAIAAIQQRFIEAQQELERDYWRQRQTEARYRLLFQVATDAVMVVDAESFSIIEANHAAAELFGCAPEALIGRSASAGIESASRPAVDELLLTARASGRPAEMRARLELLPALREPRSVDLSATPFRATLEGSSTMLLLVRAHRAEPRHGDVSRQLADFVEHTPDAVVITDSSGRVRMANPAFLRLCHDGRSEARLRGCSLAEVLGDPGRRLGALVAEVRSNGIVAGVRTQVGSGAAWQEVDVSAALLDEGDQECIGFTLRRREPPRPPALQPVGGLVAALEGLSEQLGHVSLPELVQEAAHLAEAHLIRSALQRTRGQIDAAAGWLGIAPESLALRMRRHGLQTIGEPPTLLN